MSAAPGAPPLAAGQALSGLLLPARGEIWVNAEEARLWPPRRRFTIGHELGHWVMHRTGQDALFCRRTSVDERAAPPARDIEEEASAFAAALLMPQWLFVREHAACGGDMAALGRAFGTTETATERRAAALFA
jgi:Zn-dependent peptidase ImmA (M78 family)